MSIETSDYPEMVKQELYRLHSEYQAEYALVFFFGSAYRIEAFSGKEDCFKRQIELSKAGAWSHSFELRDGHTLAYLQGHLFRKKETDYEQGKC